MTWIVHYTDAEDLRHQFVDWLKLMETAARKEEQRAKLLRERVSARTQANTYHMALDMWEHAHLEKQEVLRTLGGRLLVSGEHRVQYTIGYGARKDFRGLCGASLGTSDVFPICGKPVPPQCDKCRENIGA